MYVYVCMYVCMYIYIYIRIQGLALGEKKPRHRALQQHSYLTFPHVRLQIDATT